MARDLTCDVHPPIGWLTTGWLPSARRALVLPGTSAGILCAPLWHAGGETSTNNGCLAGVAAQRLRGAAVRGTNAQYCGAGRSDWRPSRADPAGWGIGRTLVTAEPAHAVAGRRAYR